LVKEYRKGIPSFRLQATDSLVKELAAKPTED
jgi:hypothetical protein